jgi:hypothetical protein
MAVIATSSRRLRSKLTEAGRSRSLHTGQTTHGAGSDGEARTTSDRKNMTHIVCDIAQIVTLLRLVLGELLNRQLRELIYMLESKLAVLEQVQETESLKCDSDLFGGSATHLNEGGEEVSEDLSDFMIWYLGH